MHLVRKHNFPKNWHFLPPDMHMCVCVGTKWTIFKNEIITVCYFFSKGVIELQGSGACWTKLTDIYKIEKYVQHWILMTVTL